MYVRQQRLGLRQRSVHSCKPASTDYLRFLPRSEPRNSVNTGNIEQVYVGYTGQRYDMGYGRVARFDWLYV